VFWSEVVGAAFPARAHHLDTLRLRWPPILFQCACHSHGRGCGQRVRASPEPDRPWGLHFFSRNFCVDIEGKDLGGISDVRTDESASAGIGR
jgi:hypothetical protein